MEAPSGKTSGPPCQVTRVVALPNLSNQDLEDAGVERKKDILYLLKEDLFEEDMNVSESESILDKFREWWDSISDSPTPMELDLMKEIVGKYIGPLSIVMTDKDGNERERLRHFRDCVCLTGSLLERQKPTGFEEHPLYLVHRCPPSVQNLLYHVDWDDTRKEQYKRDAEAAQMPTNGPIPLCIRHEVHAPVSVTECRQCAKELAQVLKNEKLVAGVTVGEGSQGDGGACAEPAVKDTGQLLHNTLV
nr:hypothetical protein BaRGS_002386 [Batillaria attramentaria]